MRTIFDRWAYNVLLARFKCVNKCHLAPSTFIRNAWLNKLLPMIRFWCKTTQQCQHAFYSPGQLSCIYSRDTRCCRWKTDNEIATFFAPFSPSLRRFHICFYVHPLRQTAVGCEKNPIKSDGFFPPSAGGSALENVRLCRAINEHKYSFWARRLFMAI